MAAAQPHQHHGVVLIFVQIVGKRRMRWKVRDRAARQRAGEGTDRKPLGPVHACQLVFDFGFLLLVKREE